MLPATIAPVNAQLDTVLASPELTGAMYRSLIEMGQDWLLPGLEHVPANTVTALEADNAFIEAFLVGLNHEMGRELLWRSYPTDQRGTVLAHFWDLRTPADTITLGPDGRDALRRPQISKIHTWRQTSGLGTHRPRTSPKVGLVLLLRGDLIRHFPRPGVLLAKAEWVRDAAGDVLRHPDGRAVRRPLALAPATTEAPLFTGRLDPDVLLVGYTPSADDVRGAETEAGDAGYFVLFSEQPTEPRFALSESGTAPDPVTGRLASWNDLVRSQVKTGLAGHLDLAATAAAGSFTALMPTGTTTWDGRSDSLASILLSRPFRLYVHGSDLLPPGGAP